MKISRFISWLFKPIEDAKIPELSISSTELTHINEEMYKQSEQLAERNRALSLLGDINEVLLSSITSQVDLAQKVTSLLVKEADIKIAAIFSYDNEEKVLKRLGLSEAEIDDENSQTNKAYLAKIDLAQANNVITQAIKEKSVKISHTMDNLLFSDGDSNKAKEIQDNKGIKSVYIFPLTTRDQVLGAMVICLTVTEQELYNYQNNLLNRLGEIIGMAIDNATLYNQVQENNKRLVELDKLKNEFVSVASHELRTPMTAIKSYLWMALEGKGGQLNEKQKYYIQRGYNSVDRLIRLVNDMLNISRIESGKITIDLQSTDLFKMTQEVVDEVLLRAKEVGVSIEMQKPESLPHVLADPDKIKEVLFNLIGNSLKFTPQGGTITISFSQEDDFIKTAVEDTGAGIGSEDLKKLFQKFGLIEGSYITNQTSTSMGTGLGLYICRSIIDLHHGEIKAESQGRGKGSTFSFTLKVFKESVLHTIKKESTQDKKDTAELIHSQI
jgi:signal transduction histidine kinase